MLFNTLLRIKGPPGVMHLINCRTCLTNRDSILVLISKILKPPSANVFNSDFLFKASGLLFQRNGNSNFSPPCLALS